MPESIYSRHASGPVTVKVDTPGLLVHATVSGDIEAANVHVASDRGGIAINSNGSTIGSPGTTRTD
ncbi:hypothetical protein [Streptomyces sp. 5-10]|uniref:hypothetical protein n=1 Tax=Streptomyces sp. 5-10 TaxID=878925 RepID=UPI00168AD2E5|nr:hypothetical protein [Streptomyces sp. 5-10]MBD3004753.1 hypothetical protein [Streptomyces sp. 5-10]